VYDVLQKICALWVKQVELCQKKKHACFGDTAQKIWNYVGKHYDPALMMRSTEDVDGEFPYPKGTYYIPKINKSREFVSVMMPYILAQVPVRTVTPRRPQYPPEVAAYLGAVAPSEAETLQRIAVWLLQWVLNYIPQENQLIREQRMAVPEALIKGRGLVWHSYVDGPAGKMPRSHFDTVDDLLVDADCEQLRDAGFIIRRRRASAWRLAQQYHVNPDAIRSAHKSALKIAQSAAIKPDNVDQLEGDVVEYYEGWSRMGTGRLLVGAPKEVREALAEADERQQHNFLAILPGLPYPLNLAPAFVETATAAELMAHLSWPLAVYGDSASPWPCTELDFYPNTIDPWATSPLEGALPLQVFLDHAYAYMMDRIRSTARNIYVVEDGLDADVIDKLEKGYDQEIVVTAGSANDVAKAIHIVEFPAVNPDLWRTVGMVEAAFERMTGMLPLLSGAEPERQLRSAHEAQIREAHVTSRPDDLADCVEDWNSRIATKEAQIARLYTDAPSRLLGEPEDAPIGGNQAVTLGPLSHIWETLIHTDDPYEAAGEFFYTVEAGTGRRKNKQKQAADAQLLVQTLLPAYLQFAAGGYIKPYNALIGIMSQWLEMPLEQLMIEIGPVMQNPEEEAARLAERKAG
jgi:hypothetical protein